MAFRLAAISLRQVLRLLLLRCRSLRSKDLELWVLRQELDVLHRQVPRPRFRPEERWVLSVLQHLRPVQERLSSLVTPDTIRRWHRAWSALSGATVIGSCRGDESPTTCGFWSGVWPARTRPGATATSDASSRNSVPRTRRRASDESWPRSVDLRQSARPGVSSCEPRPRRSSPVTSHRRVRSLEDPPHPVLHRPAHKKGPHRRGDRRCRQRRLVRPNRPEPDRGARRPRSSDSLPVHDRDKRFCPVVDEVFHAEGIEILRTRGGHRRPTPMPNGSSAPFAPSASIGCFFLANCIFDQCWRPTSSTTTENDPIAGSTLLRRKEPKTSRR